MGPTTNYPACTSDTHSLRKSNIRKPSSYEIQGDRKTPQRQSSLFEFLIRVLHTTIHQLNTPKKLQVTHYLPHILLIIWEEGNITYLKALYDSGTVLNMGQNKYYEAVMRLYQDLVVSSIYFIR